MLTASDCKSILDCSLEEIYEEEKKSLIAEIDELRFQNKHLKLTLSKYIIREKAVKKLMDFLNDMFVVWRALNG